ncbi:MAG: hypothetical protein QNK23_04030 [Crocinitomicaceae bacterium]|nr:hypothetical protein [Crocinitomicaceae bacterium]
MKRLLYTLVLLVGFGSVAMAQADRRANITISEGNTELLASKTSGEYTFTLPEGITGEDVANKSKYYTSSMTVVFDESTQVAQLTMVDNTVQSRYVIPRFLTACGTHNIRVDDTLITIDEFIEDYLK